MSQQKTTALFQRIRRILESARAGVARSVNTTQVVANWLVGREILEEEQKGSIRAEYGKRIIEDMAVLLQKEFGIGYSALNLWLFRRFYAEYNTLLPIKIPYAMRKESYGQALVPEILYAVRKESWKPGMLHVNLSWTHYRALLGVEKLQARSFYEIESIRNNWSARELERQINSLLFERLALSKDKKGLMRLATKGQEVQKPADVFKEPVVMEFLGLPESPALVETKIETALINNLQAFLLELGRGFAFVSRQERITIEGDHLHLPTEAELKAEIRREVRLLSGSGENAK